MGSIIGLALALIPAFLFREYEGLPTSGKYEIASTETILIDRSRVEAFEIDGSFREIPTHFFYPADAEDGETFPLVLFSHGAFGYYQSNMSLYQELVSNGYVVVSLDHLYHAFLQWILRAN